MSDTDDGTFPEFPKKDPGEDLDYQIRWLRILAGDIIANSAWSANDVTLVLSNSSYTNSTSTVWVANGTSNTTPLLTNTITTGIGRVFVQSLIIPIDPK